MQGCTGRDTHGNAFLAGKMLRGCEGVFVGCFIDLVIDTCIQYLRNKSGTDTLDLMGAGFSFGKDR